ncbi:MAG TPA: hypothetical protein VHS31_06320 [Tepidisphaeraceae bacterium]|jgi:hypothetical protein|nr:hypothetical protein [Tepidisphaeraceae bacterium]
MMPDQPNSKRSLSEISHLFLSSVRERQTGGAAKPVRKPPTAKPDVSIDLTPEEFAQVVGQGAAESISAEPGPVTAILSSHLTEGSFDRAREYAAHLAADGARIGLIECDSSIFRLMCFERSLDSASIEAEEPVMAEGFDVRRMCETLEEMSWDVDHWLLLLPSPRTHEARALLRNIGHWVLLSTCDHDGVVSCYRTLKGLTDLNRPRISLALLDASDEVEAERVFTKLSSVSQQFLSCPLETEPSVRRPTNVVEHLALCCRATRDKSPLATPPQWQLVSDFLARSKSAAPVQKETTVPHIQPVQDREPLPKQMVADIVIPDVASGPVAAEPMHNNNEISDVLDLPEGISTPAAIIGAVMHDGSNQLIECPVKPPMCPDATLAVSRDHCLTLLAVARQGLSDLRSIGRAYQWLMENRGLVAMAVPQFAIDAHQLPKLQLLIDEADVSAEILQPMLQSGNVTVVAYRKLRWAGRTGLLLKAA